MTRESVREWTQRQPFTPFVLRLSNGTDYPIRHPEFAMPTLDTVIVGIPDDDSSEPAVNRVKMVSMLHIVEIVPLKDDAKVNRTNSKN